MMDQSVIHKQVYRLDAPVRVQEFEVPGTAELVSVGWDTREEYGVAFWYRFRQAHEGAVEPEYVDTWRLTLRGTGDPFMDKLRHLATVVRNGFAWHLFDADGYHIRWAR